MGILPVPRRGMGIPAVRRRGMGILPVRRRQSVGGAAIRVEDIR
jgi:hypothetical protein